MRWLRQQAGFLFDGVSEVRSAIALSDASGTAAGGYGASPEADPIRRAMGPLEARLTIPYPPSANRIWRSIVIGGRARLLISREGREYRELVSRILGPRRMMLGTLSLSIDAFPPDRRKRDIDNIAKATLDALTHAGVWEDDSQINRLTIAKHEADGNGRLELLLMPIPE